MERATPIMLDLNAQAAKLTMLRGRTPLTTFAERRDSGSAVHLGRYRDGMLLLAKSAGKSHWETHPADELLYVLDGEMTVDILETDGPRSFTLGAGMIGIVPPGAWHRVHSADGMSVFSATLPGDHIELDVDDPRTAARELETASGTVGVIDLYPELARLTMFRELRPQSTREERKGSGASLAPYRDGILFATKFAGTCHWETHPADELVHIFDGATTLEIVCDDGPPQSFALGSGAIAVVRQGAWHRFRSAEGVTMMTATPLPGEHIERDVDDPRMVERPPG